MCAALASCTASSSAPGPRLEEEPEPETFGAERAAVGAVADDATEPSVLELVSEPRVKLAFSEQALIEVRLLDDRGDPLPRKHVSFALVGRTRDASLATLSSVTNGEGLATNTLMAGESVATFEVRISAPGAQERYVDVSISDSGFGTLSVLAAYEGNRAIVERTVVAQAGATCATNPERMPGDPTVTLTTEDSTTFLALPAETDYAVTAIATGLDDVVLATACVDAVRVSQDEDTEVTIVFDDEPLTPTGSFLLQAELDSSVPAATLAGAVALAADALISTDATGLPAPTLAEARFLLDSLEQTLRSEDYQNQASFTGLADVLAMERSAPTLVQSLDESLQAALDDASVGPSVAVTRLVELTQEGLSSIRLSAAMIVDKQNGELPITWQARTMTSAPVTEGGAGLSVELSALEGDTTTVADFLPDLDRVDLVEARFPVAYGALTVQVVRKVAGEDGAGDEIHGLLGCDTLASWLLEQDLGLAQCGSACVQAACDRTLTRLLGAAESALLAIDEQRSSLTLHGELSLGDDDGDLLVERMATDLLWGGWDAEDPQDEGDFVSGTATAAMQAPDAL